VTTDTAAFNPLAPGYNNDPYPLYDALRRETPVLHLPELNFWVISRFADNKAVLLNTEQFSSSIVQALLTGKYDPVPEAEGVLMMAADPPEHTRLRRLIGPSFTPKAVSALRPKVDGFVAEAIARMREMDEFDFSETLGRALPVDTFFTLAGFPREMHAQGKKWANAMFETARYAGGGQAPSPETDARLRALATEYAEFLKGFVASRKEHPVDDLTSGWVRDISVDNPLWEVEARKMLHLLVAAGSESTEKLLANMMLAFADHPGEYRRVVEDPSLIPGAVLEVLRYDGAALHMGRISTDDVEVAGTLIPANSIALLSFGAANHDPDEFDDPETFDVTRDPKGVLSHHMGFGYGVHRCLGAHLATLEAESVLGQLIEAFPNGLSYDPRRVERDDVFFTRGPIKLVMSAN
jgi:pimeloyl-[acyl-carrier protein] synthase